MIYCPGSYCDNSTLLLNFCNYIFLFLLASITPYHVTYTSGKLCLYYIFGVNGKGVIIITNMMQIIDIQSKHATLIKDQIFLLPHSHCDWSPVLTTVKCCVPPLFCFQFGPECSCEYVTLLFCNVNWHLSLNNFKHGRPPVLRAVTF